MIVLSFSRWSIWIMLHIFERQTASTTVRLFWYCRGFTFCSSLWNDVAALLDSILSLTFPNANIYFKSKTLQTVVSLFHQPKLFCDFFFNSFGRSNPNCGPEHLVPLLLIHHKIQRTLIPMVMFFCGKLGKWGIHRSILYIYICDIHIF